MATLKERVAQLEVHKDVHAKDLRDLNDRLESATFYLKSIGYLLGVLTVHVIGTPYAQALGDLLAAWP